MPHTVARRIRTPRNRLEAYLRPLGAGDSGRSGVTGRLAVLVLIICEAHTNTLAKARRRRLRVWCSGLSDRQMVARKW